MVLYVKFKDNPAQTSFGVSPRGFLAYGGIVLMLAAVCAACVGMKVLSH